MCTDWELEPLLSMDGEVHEVGEGLWFKFNAKKVDPTPERPHGIRYNLTLHDRGNHRIFSIDTAHGLPKKSKSPGKKRRVEFDHKHNGQEIKFYEYTSAADLMKDFFEAVDAEKAKRGIP
jgi:hypothetical protein